MRKRVKLRKDEDCVVIQLPDGKEITIGLNDIESGALPELYILLPEPMVANCWMPGLVPAVPLDAETQYALETTEIHIPVENAGFGAKFDEDQKEHA